MTSTKSIEKVAGILGGMGPEATVDLMQRIIANTPAIDDIDHIRCLIDNDPKVPSRMQAILGKDGENPGPYLARMAKGLEGWGADFLVIPCNTAHAYYSNVAEAVDIPVVHLIDLVVDQVVKLKGTTELVGILGSNTIVKTQLYTEKFAAVGMQVIYPDDEVQEQLFQIIRRVKKGETDIGIRQELRAIAQHLKEKGATTAILGCTELGIIAEDLPILVIDAAELLAQEVVAVAKNKKAPHIESLRLDKDSASD
ncbi:MAG: amino acid racemase [Desulfocapsaceae bacterium]|nr:amino acid racemase [Desulfocapsaceae bacterium]